MDKYSLDVSDKYLRFALEKLDLNGTEDNKDIVILQFLDDGSAEQVMSLKEEITKLKDEANWKHVTFLMLPPHIRLSKISDEDLESMGLQRI